MSNVLHKFDYLVIDITKYLQYVTDKTRVDIDLMAYDLQWTFDEKYSMFSRSFFSAVVRKVYSTMLKKLGLKQNILKNTLKNEVIEPKLSWNDVGGLSYVKKILKHNLRCLEMFGHGSTACLEMTVPKFLLLYGESGCGKTMVAKAIKRETSVPFISFKAPQMLSFTIGETEAAINLCFQMANFLAPCILFFDEVEALCRIRSTNRRDNDGYSHTITEQFLSQINGYNVKENVLILGTTNQKDVIDPRIFLINRMKILLVKVPSAFDRADILRIITKDGTQPQMAPDVDLWKIGRSSTLKGFTGADLQNFVTLASTIALREHKARNNRRRTRRRPVIINYHLYIAGYIIQKNKGKASGEAAK